MLTNQFIIKNIKNYYQRSLLLLSNSYKNNNNRYYSNSNDSNFIISPMMSLFSHALPVNNSINQLIPSSQDIFSKLLNERIIYLVGEINDQISTIITAQLLYLESQSTEKPIHIYINSPGGSVTSGLAIYDTIQYLKSPISTVCLGQACSMASLLLTCGTKGKRLVLPNSIIMVHQPSGGIQGQATDIEIHANHIINTKKNLQNLYLKHLTPKEGTIIDETKIMELLERDKFLNATEAIDIGLVDKILLPRK
ncbi:serine-type endopeptidase activity protein [[Candida] boidinii]|nr:serine-type endopeptidase activity protein [[Candida] boidinii]OWB75378.1 serine-type endopeptidase activity protein [[Candida] boidinii]OWB81374.1 serine-type endopeptidase activity protein [[Candida] boidinii]